MLVPQTTGRIGGRLAGKIAVRVMHVAGRKQPDQLMCAELRALLAGDRRAEHVIRAPRRKRTFRGLITCKCSAPKKSEWIHFTSKRTGISIAWRTLSFCFTFTTMRLPPAVTNSPSGQISGNFPDSPGGKVNGLGRCTGGQFEGPESFGRENLHSRERLSDKKYVAVQIHFLAT